MTEVISVRFSLKGKLYYFTPKDISVPDGVSVVVETANGIEFGECVRGNHEVPDSAVVQPLRALVRLADENDIQRSQDNKVKEKEAAALCRERIEHYKLEMKLVSVEYNFDGSKILFFFTSDSRVDFRELVRDLASGFHTRIELRQIGVRDEARMLGGLGVCGKQFCCSQFMNNFHPVSIKMAKTQGLSLNPTKISGTCGRLMCCLKYEEFAYEDLVKKAPKIDSFVETPSGKGSVININLLRGTAKVRLEDGNDTTLKTIPFDELTVLGGKSRRAEYVSARAEGRLKEAGFTPSPPPPRVVAPAEIIPPITAADSWRPVFSDSAATPPRHEQRPSPRPPQAQQKKRPPAPTANEHSAPVPERTAAQRESAVQRKRPNFRKSRFPRKDKPKSESKPEET